MINRFDTYSEIMPDYCMDCPERLIFEMSAISRYEEGFLA